VSLETTRAAPEGDRPPSNNQVAATQPDRDSLPIGPAYCVLAYTPYDRTYRRLFLSLHSAVQAVERTRKRSLNAELLLCRLTPVQAVDLDGGELS
jgi:hypothetical protein